MPVLDRRWRAVRVSARAMVVGLGLRARFAGACRWHWRAHLTTSSARSRPRSQHPDVQSTRESWDCGAARGSRAYARFVGFGPSRAVGGNVHVWRANVCSRLVPPSSWYPIFFHLGSYSSCMPVSPHEEVRMTACARHFGPLPMVEMRFPLLNGAFRNDDASGHMCVYVCMFLCLCLCAGV